MPILGIMASQMSGKLWQPDGAFDSLATITVGSGGVASVEFAGIPNTYKHLQIRGITQSNRPIYTTDNLNFQVGNGSIDTGANYSKHSIFTDYQSGSVVYADANVNSTDMGNAYTTTVVANAFGAFIIDILDYANTSKYKTARVLSGADGNGSVLGYNPSVGLASGSWRSTSSITNVRLTLFLSTLNQYSTFSLYGIK